MSERPQTGELSGIAKILDQETLQKGEYLNICITGIDVRFNKWGMEWPIGELDDEIIEQYVAQSQYKSLREIVGIHIVNEGKTLWKNLKPQNYDSDPGDRSVVDIAINEGYIEAGKTLQYAVIDDESHDSLIIDPTGLDWLDIVIENEQLIWNEQDVSVRNYTTPEDPGVMGYKQARERYEQLYYDLVKHGAKPDGSVNIVKLAVVRTKRDIIRKIKGMGLDVASNISGRFKSKD